MPFFQGCNSGSGDPIGAAMILGSPNFNSYDRNLRRVLWAEFLEGQLRAARANQFRANIIENPLDEQKTLTAFYNQSRQGEK